MIFNTWTFAVFAISVLAVYWVAIPQRVKPYYLIAFGAMFYAWAVPAYLALIAAMGAVTFAGVRLLVRPGMSSATRKLVFVVAVAAVVAVLVYFKYLKFAATIVDAVARASLFPVPRLVVPLAISFFTFEFVHVLVDAYIGKLKVFNALDFAVFTMFFPTLVAGPIKRYQSFAPQVRRIVPPTRLDMTLNVYRIAIGLFKKIVIADSMNVLVAPLAAPGAPYGPVDAWTAWLAYAAKIYFDFTGYSDIAIGVAGLLGIAIPENFDRPYWAPNIAMFWRRWHMSLSTWIRDYVFIPLGGSKRPPIVTMMNLLVAMAIAGLWHGAAWTFLLWGLWHGFGLITHRLWSMRVVPHVAFLTEGGALVRALSVGTTFAFVAFGWVLFAATSFPNAMTFFKQMFSAHA